MHRPHRSAREDIFDDVGVTASADRKQFWGLGYIMRMCLIKSTERLYR